MLETIVDDHPQHLVVIGGDLNTELKGDSPFDPLWNNFISKNQFAYCNNRFSSPGYTYHHETLGHKKQNDHFIVSKKIYDDGLMNDHKILEDGNNLSDHLPILMKMSIQISPNNTNQKVRKKSLTLNRDKLNSIQTTCDLPNHLARLPRRLSAVVTRLTVMTTVVKSKFRLNTTI